jgi:hypothetical protein
MDARRPVEFTGVELAAPVEKGVAGPMVKALADRSGGEGHGGREARLRKRFRNLITNFGGFHYIFHVINIIHQEIMYKYPHETRILYYTVIFITDFVACWFRTGGDNH